MRIIGTTMRILLVAFCYFVGCQAAGLDCNFDNGLCNWKQPKYDDRNWRLRRGSTPTSGTGPGGDHTSGEGKYLYFEADRTRPGFFADLVYKTFTGSKCLNFWYHMNGNGVGELNVWVDEEEVFHKAGSQGNAWKLAQVNINGDNSEVIFEGVRGRTNKGDIAIDDVYLTDACGSPPVPTANPPPPTQPPNTAEPPPPGGCGIRPNTRIVGGVDAKRGDWPWQAMLTDSRGSQFCGGSLIAPQWVLSAAHCVERTSPKDVKVRMGAHRRKQSDPGEQKFGVVEIIPHENYHKPIQMSHDIALLKLDRPAKMDSFTNLVCLPTHVTDVSEGDHCWLTGWGTLKSGGSQPNILQQVSVPVVSQNTCEKSYKNEIHGSMICAGYAKGGKDACQGDSGGPMVCERGGRFYLHGATSWGYGCAEPNKYGVYARVHYLTKWITDKMGVVPQTPAPPHTPAPPQTPPPPQTPAPPETPAPPVTSPPSGGCGTRPNTRIVGGTAAKRGDWPWQAMLTDSRGSQFCGGSLINSQWVLTASHCVERTSPQKVKVRMGAHRRTKSDPGEQKFSVVKIIMHESYHKPIQMSHDIALLKLDRPAKMDSFTNLVCLPTHVPDVSDGARCWLTGWGTLKSGGSQPEILQQVSVPVVSQNTCEKSYRNQIHGSMICAGYAKGGKDACQGDSGGPMVCERGGRFYLHGATSWGYGCAEPNKYGVYARVHYLTKWITDKMGKN